MTDTTNEPPKKPKGGGRGSGRKGANSEKAKLNADIQHKIGQQLRAMYTDVVNEGVPDRFADLISRLDKQDKS